MKKPNILSLFLISIIIFSISIVNNCFYVCAAEIDSIPGTERTFSDYNPSFLSVTGYAKGKVNDRTQYINTEYYRIVKDGDEFISAISDANAGKVKVIEIIGDINLGYYELSEASRNSGCLEKYEDPVVGYTTGNYTNPTIKQSGVIKLCLNNINGLTVFSQSGNTIRHAEIKLQPSSKDIIFRNINFDDMWQWDEAGTHKEVGWSFFKINGAKNVWLDHCTFSIGADALIDLENASSGVTYSWCRFSLKTEVPKNYSPIYKTVSYMEYLYQNDLADHDGRYYKLRKNGVSVDDIMKYECFHSKCFGVGNEKQFKDIGTGTIPEDCANRVRLTMAYDYLTNVGQRIPRLSFGRAHLMNVYIDSMDHMLLNKNNSILNSYGGLRQNICINVHTAGSCGADTCVFYGENGVISGHEIQGNYGGTGLSTDPVLSNCWINARNRSLVVNSKVTNVAGKTYSGSSWDNNGDNLFTNSDFNWDDKKSIGNWAWASNIVGVENMDRAAPPSTPFEFIDDNDAKLDYDYQLVPLDNVEETLKNYAGAFVYNLSPKDWLRTSYDSTEDIKAVDKTSQVIATSIKIRQEAQRIPIGSVLQLDADVIPGNVSDRSVTWSTSDSEIADVLDSGLVIAKKAGNVVIKATSNDGSNVSSSITLRSYKAVSSILLNKKSMSINCGESTMIDYYVDPLDAENTKVIWTSSNEKSVTVDSDGKITGIGTGISIITCKSEDNPSIKTTIRVTVKDDDNFKTEAPTESVSPTETFIPLLKGDVNNDKIVSATDALIVLKHAAALQIITDTNSFNSGDINNDLILDATDALSILKISAGLK